MPRGDFNIYFATSRRGIVRAEEAVGIALLVVILAALLILGCWYFKKRSGYKIIRNPRTGSPAYSGGQFSEAGPSADNKMALTDFGSFQPVPKAHDRGLLFNTTPQGSENSVQHMKRMEWISEGEIIMSPDFGEVPNAPPAYEKISSGPLPPPYSP